MVSGDKKLYRGGGIISLIYSMDLLEEVVYLVLWYRGDKKLYRGGGIISLIYSMDLLGEVVYLVLWYRGDEGEPLYSYDSRQVTRKFKT